MLHAEPEAAIASADADDDALVIHARTNRNAFARLYDLHYPRILRYSLRRLFLRGVAEDVTSEVFLRVAAGMPAFPGRTHDDFSRWLYAIATNEINAYLRKTHRRTRLLEEAVRQKALPVANPSGTPTESNPGWPRVYEAILTLSERDQAIVTLRFYEDLSHEQIAAVLGMRPGAVRAALFRAIAKLRRDLGVNP